MSFINVVFYAYQLYVNFLQKNNLGSIEWINISNLSIKLLFKLLRVYSEVIYFDF